jgi:hypothetical protein
MIPGWDLPLLSFFRWLAILGTLTFGVVTIWFFSTAHRGVFVGFLVVTILFGLLWRVAPRCGRNKPASTGLQHAQH